MPFFEGGKDSPSSRNEFLTRKSWGPLSQNTDFFSGKYRPIYDDFFQVGLYTDFLRKYGPLYKLCSWQKPVSSWENPVTSWYNQ